jgi:hypothetical protein
VESEGNESSVADVRRMMVRMFNDLKEHPLKYLCHCSILYHIPEKQFKHCLTQGSKGENFPLQDRYDRPHARNLPYIIFKNK